MDKWKKASHVIYQCKYHIVWCPKYRYRILKGAVADFVEDNIRLLCEWQKVEILEMSICEDHIHLILEIPPKSSISKVLGILKGKLAIKLFKSYPALKKKPYWGNHFWSRGYCVSTIGLDEKRIRKYVKYQEEHEKKEEKDQRQFDLF